MSWRALLQKSIPENLYAKHAKLPEPGAFPWFLQAEPTELNGAIDQKVTPTVPAGFRLPLKARSWAEWKAEMLNQLFQEQGRSGQRGRITAATVQQGERSVE
jgi:hypothetical protein